MSAVAVGPWLKDPEGFPEERLAGVEVKGGFQRRDPVEARVGKRHPGGGTQMQAHALLEAGRTHPLARLLDLRPADVEAVDGRGAEAADRKQRRIAEAEAAVEHSTAGTQVGRLAQHLCQPLAGIVEAGGAVPVAGIEIGLDSPSVLFAVISS